MLVTAFDENDYGGEKKGGTWGASDMLPRPAWYDVDSTWAVSGCSQYLWMDHGSTLDIDYTHSNWGSEAWDAQKMMF